MITKILTWTARMALGKKLLSIVDGTNERLIGHRSEILIGLIALLSLLKHFGIIPDTIADGTITALLGALPVTLAEKVGNVISAGNKIIPPPTIPSA